MSDEQRPHEAPWKSLPRPPWLRSGVIRVERESSVGKSKLVAIVVSDPSNDAGPSWLQHWMMPASESFPLNIVLGGELEFRWTGTGSQTAAQLAVDAGKKGELEDEHGVGTALEVRTLKTSLTGVIPVP
jgi:hypothetical protein